MNSKKKSDLIGTVWERESGMIIKVIDTSASGNFKIWLWWSLEKYNKGEKRDSIYFDCVPAFYIRITKDTKGRKKYKFIERTNK